MNAPVRLPSAVSSLDHNLTLPLLNHSSIYPTEPINNCSVALQYSIVEQIIYLYLMSPLCVIGLILNVINLIIFSDRSFKNLTFKYLRLIAFVDCITSTLVFIYCVTNYTRPRTFNDKYFRVWYLVNVYFPLANITAGCNVLLTITVTIERLVSIRWPMSKQKLFSQNNVLLTLIICFLFPIVANSVNFLVYKVGECNNLDGTKIARTEAYKYFGIFKEILLRFIPICILVCSNCLLLSTVHAANKKFIPSKNARQSATEASITVSLQPLSNGLDTKPINKYISESQSQTDTRSPILPESTTNGDERKTSVPVASKTKMQIRKQQQEKQLTIMLVWISTLYLCGQIPMLFAYPNFVFKDTNKPAYKHYALVVNLLELVTYLANFCIYIKFTTQFRQVFRTKVKQLFFCFFKTA
ncbi:unnamed protein product [Rotaria socialis]|uniref:G-protein coupled receptors family 1 profile domain-containing protein n=1 Tax=Rotaria socialis TaxID=392032 RepID=A0A821E980_9BILA|nr:unnamed protein product [Rotaria socialis]CAF3757852.1 unnamed protein product [Rotaria socialis]CAF4394227.1 unnamed protein product [Rotaria socialis]CAF4631789.1 unnamed protein product [Rotaria socialis]